MERIPLGNAEFEGRNNAYVLDGGGSIALVDTGIATDRTEADLRAGLDDLGYGFADVDRIVLTHWHPDHSGLAGEIQSESDATVYVHEADAPLVEQREDAVEGFDALRQRYFEEWGIPIEKREELLSFLDGHADVAGEPASVEAIADGDRIDVGEFTLRTVHAPGHAAGACCFAFEEDREAFVGDVVLPVYTPNVGGADVRVDRPLERYLETLRAVERAGYDRCWPGHRDPIDDPADRARTIVDHHRERTERVVGVLREHGPADAWTVSAHLFGGLEGIHIMHGPGEAYAHLDHLRRHGVVNETDGTYAIADADAEVDSDALVPGN